MKDKLFDELKESLGEVLDHAQGKITLKSKDVVMPDKDGRGELNNSDTGEGTLEGQLKASKWPEVGVCRPADAILFPS